MKIRRQLVGRTRLMRFLGWLKGFIFNERSSRPLIFPLLRGDFHFISATDIFYPGLWFFTLRTSVKET
jgi:hypothetical protein